MHDQHIKHLADPLSVGIMGAYEQDDELVFQATWVLDQQRSFFHRLHNVGDVVTSRYPPIDARKASSKNDMYEGGSQFMISNSPLKRVGMAYWEEWLHARDRPANKC